MDDLLTIIFCTTVILSIIAIVWLEYDYYKVKVSAVSSVPWMRRAVRNVIKKELIEKGIEPKIIYELGSGWGPLVMDAAKLFPKARVIGVEFSFLAAHFSRMRAFLLGRRNVEIRRNDFFKEDLGDADLVIFYMLEIILERLSPKMIEELPKGAIIVSNTFTIKGWEPVAVHEVMKKPIPLKVYVYKVPESLPKAA